MSRLKLILFFGLVFVLMGCDKQGDFLGRSNVSASSVLAPLDGVLAKLVQDPNILYSSPNTKQTVDIVFSDKEKPFKNYNDNADIRVLTMQNKLAELTPSDSNPVYRYFRYAEGVSIPAYKLLEGTNITIDKTYKGESDKPLETKNITRTNGQKYDTPSPTSLMPVFGRVLNPNLKRWSSNPELFTLRKDYLTPNAPTEQDDLNLKQYLSSYGLNEPEKLVLDGEPTNGDKKPPALIFVLYEPSSYWQTDNRKNRVNDNTLYYFDVYYSIDQWNMFVDKQSGDVNEDNHPDGLRLPNDFGVCNYDNNLKSGTQTVLKMPLGLPRDEPGCNPLPTLHKECGLFGFSGHCCISTGDCPQETPIPPKPTVDGDLEFTLITMLTDPIYTALAQKDQETHKYSQPDVNLWVKHEFIEMLQSGDATFAVTSDKLKPLNEKNRFSPKNNLQVPQWLYSEEAVNANMDACTLEPDPEQCVLDHSRYKVQYTLSPLDTYYYHNRTLIVDDTIYERVASPATSNGARAQSAIPDWIWCWFMPE